MFGPRRAGRPSFGWPDLAHRPSKAVLTPGKCGSWKAIKAGDDASYATHEAPQGCPAYPRLTPLCDVQLKESVMQASDELLTRMHAGLKQLGEPFNT